jgi:hypothetical protein
MRLGRGIVGPGPDRWAAPSSGPSTAYAGDVRRARCRPETEWGVGAVRWAAAQCRVAVPLTGGSSLLVGVERGRAGSCGPTREGAEVGRARLNSKVLHLFELV